MRMRRTVRGLLGVGGHRRRVRPRAAQGPGADAGHRASPGRRRRARTLRSSGRAGVRRRDASRARRSAAARSSADGRGRRPLACRPRSARRAAGTNALPPPAIPAIPPVAPLTAGPALRDARPPRRRRRRPARRPDLRPGPGPHDPARTSTSSPGGSRSPRPGPTSSPPASGQPDPLRRQPARSPTASYSKKRPGGPTQYDLNVSQPIDFSRKRTRRVAVATRTRKAVELQYQDAVRVQIGNLAIAYVGVVVGPGDAPLSPRPA